MKSVPFGINPDKTYPNRCETRGNGRNFLLDRRTWKRRESTQNDMWAFGCFVRNKFFPALIEMSADMCGVWTFRWQCWPGLYTF